jgi:hypothetical protein
MKHLRILCAALLAAVFAQGAFAATCKISEYTALAADLSGKEIQVAMEPRITSQSVTYTTSAQSAALNSATRFVRIVCDAKAHYRFSTAGTNATANDPYLAVDAAEYFGVPPGGALIIDFYDGSS